MSSAYNTKLILEQLLHQPLLSALINDNKTLAQETANRHSFASICNHVAITTYVFSPVNLIAIILHTTHIPRQYLLTRYQFSVFMFGFLCAGAARAV